MTHLERLIQMHVDAPQRIRLSRATEKLAEDMAREIVNDPRTRAAPSGPNAREANATDKISTVIDHPGRPPGHENGHTLGQAHRQDQLVPKPNVPQQTLLSIANVGVEEAGLCRAHYRRVRRRLGRGLES